MIIVDIGWNYNKNYDGNCQNSSEEHNGGSKVVSIIIVNQGLKVISKYIR